MNSSDRVESARSSAEARQQVSHPGSAGPGAGPVWAALMRYLVAEQYREKKLEAEDARTKSSNRTR